MTYKPTLCLDFDGVLHSYHSWSEYIADDPPVPGAVRFCKRAQEHFELVVYSSRCYDESQKLEVEMWLKKNRFPEMEVTCMKPIAFLTLDDRAITFTGTFPRIHTLKKFEPWWKRRTNADAAAVSEGSEEEDEVESEVEGR